LVFEHPFAGLRDSWLSSQQFEHIVVEHDVFLVATSTAPETLIRRFAKQILRPRAIAVRAAAQVQEPRPEGSTNWLLDIANSSVIVLVEAFDGESLLSVETGTMMHECGQCDTGEPKALIGQINVVEVDRVRGGSQEWVPLAVLHRL
jgi:hypothetical protein